MWDAWGYVYWAGIIGVGCFYWFVRSSERDSYLLRRYKTGFAAIGWPVYLAYLLVRQVLAQRSAV